MPDEPRKVRTAPFDPARYLDTPESQGELIADALATRDPDYIRDALSIIARANGFELRSAAAPDQPAMRSVLARPRAREWVEIGREGSNVYKVREDEDGSVLIVRSSLADDGPARSVLIPPGVRPALIEALSGSGSGSETTEPSEEE